MQEKEARRCALTGEMAPPSALLKFVLSPSGRMVFDRRQDLPGEAFWLMPLRRAVLEWTAREGLPEALALEVERQLRDRTLGNLALLRRSGGLVPGFEKVKAAIGKSNVAALLQAQDAADDGKAKLAKLALHHHIPVIGCFRRAELAQVTGQENQTHLALLKNGLTAKFLAESRFLLGYLEE